MNEATDVMAPYRQWVIDNKDTQLWSYASLCLQAALAPFPKEAKGGTAIGSLYGRRLTVEDDFTCQFTLFHPTHMAHTQVIARYHVHKRGCQILFPVRELRPHEREVIVMALRTLWKLGKNITPHEEAYGVFLSMHERMDCRDEMPREFWPSNFQVKEARNPR